VVLNAKYHAQEAESSRRQVGSARSRSPRTWPAAARTFCSAATRSSWRASRRWPIRVAERLPKGQEKFIDDDEFVYFFHLDSFLPRARARLRAIFTAPQGSTTPSTTRSSKLGGLHIIGTERHEARRIDNQLRGRAGRQGDPGSSRSTSRSKTTLMRIFGIRPHSRPDANARHGRRRADRARHGHTAIERAQKQVESNNFSTRKHLLEYDDVMNKQRENVYALRRELLEGKITIGEAGEDGEPNVVDSRGYVTTIAEELVEELVETHASKEQDPEEWDLGGLARAASDLFGIEPEVIDALDIEHTPVDQLTDKIYGAAIARTTRRRSRSASIRRFSAASSATSCCRLSMRSGRTTSTASTI
jgi:preprotein translocase subunit SecA